MRTDRLIRIDANLGPGYVAHYFPDLGVTASCDFQVLTHAEQQEVNQVVDLTVVLLDGIFDQVNEGPFLVHRKSAPRPYIVL